MKHFFKLSCIVYFDHDHERDDYPPDASDMRAHFDSVFSYAQNHREALCEEIQIAGGRVEFKPLSQDQAYAMVELARLGVAP